MKRRRFLGLAPGALVFGACSGQDSVKLWKGIYMGIEVSVKYRGELDLEEALIEVRDAEAALTMWEEDSPLVRLNRTGVLDNPPEHLRNCLERARELYEASDGLFDPTIRSYLEWLKTEYGAGRKPGESEVREKLRLVDFSEIQFSNDRITMPEGMALDLNAIAQGYLTDIVAERLAVESALVNFGEFRVVGDQSWPVDVGSGTIDLTRALAVSSGSGQRISAAAQANHLMDPNTGMSPDPGDVFSIEADEAWLADGLATLVAVGGEIPGKYLGRAKFLRGVN